MFSHEKENRGAFISRGERDRRLKTSSRKKGHETQFFAHLFTQKKRFEKRKPWSYFL